MSKWLSTTERSDDFPKALKKKTKTPFFTNRNNSPEIGGSTAFNSNLSNIYGIQNNLPFDLLESSRTTEEIVKIQLTNRQKNLPQLIDSINIELPNFNRTPLVSPITPINFQVFTPAAQGFLGNIGKTHPATAIPKQYRKPKNVRPQFHLDQFPPGMCSRGGSCESKHRAEKKPRGIQILSKKSKSKPVQKVINILDPHFDFNDGINHKQNKSILQGQFDSEKVVPGSNMDFSEENMLYKQEYYKCLPIRHNQPPTVADSDCQSDDSTVKMIKGFNETELQIEAGRRLTAKQVENSMPEYIKKDNPDAQFLSLKIKMSKQPKCIDRPPAETFESTIKQYFKKSLTRNRRRLKTLDTIDTTESELRRNQNYLKLFGGENLTLEQINLNNNRLSQLQTTDHKSATNVSNLSQKPTEADSEIQQDKHIKQFLIEQIQKNPKVKNRPEVAQFIDKSKFNPLPQGLFSKDTQNIFDPNFKPVKPDVPYKAPYLQYKKVQQEEKVGDYLGSKIPSLLEFMENKIQMREIQGFSKVVASGNEPKGVNHRMPRKLRQEEKLEKLMQEKDYYHKSVVFESEKSQPFVVPQIREQFKKLIKHKSIVNPTIHAKIFERVVYKAINQ